MNLYEGMDSCYVNKSLNQICTFWGSLLLKNQANPDTRVRANDFLFWGPTHRRSYYSIIMQFFPLLGRYRLKSRGQSPEGVGFYKIPEGTFRHCGV